MTFVLNQKADMLLNVERCSYLYVGEDNCVKAIMDGAKMVRVGTYTDYDCACAALEDVAARIKSGDMLYCKSKRLVSMMLQAFYFLQLFLPGARFF
nr:MAG TPA: hypothetical protein [Caudoviricetes sp.]